MQFGIKCLPFLYTSRNQMQIWDLIGSTEEQEFEDSGSATLDCAVHVTRSKQRTGTAYPWAPCRLQSTCRHILKWSRCVTTNLRVCLFVGFLLPTSTICSNLRLYLSKLQKIFVPLNSAYTHFSMTPLRHNQHAGYIFSTLLSLSTHQFLPFSQV